MPNIVSAARKLPLPHCLSDDMPCWRLSESGILTFKEAYLWFKPVVNSCPWGNLIWKNHISPYRAFMLWRAINCKMPVDDEFKKRGCHLASMCNLCEMVGKTSIHLFLQCPFAVEIWNCLSSFLILE